VIDGPANEEPTWERFTIFNCKGCGKTIKQKRIYHD